MVDDAAKVSPGNGDGKRGTRTMTSYVVGEYAPKIEGPTTEANPKQSGCWLDQVHRPSASEPSQSGALAVYRPSKFSHPVVLVGAQRPFLQSGDVVSQLFAVLRAAKNHIDVRV